MSIVFLYQENKIYGYGEYVSMEESIAPRETEFGTDGKNGEWKQYEGIQGARYTFFSHTQSHHVMVTKKSDGTVGFASREGKFNTNHFMYDTERTKRHQSFQVFGKVLHVVLSDKPKHIRFSGEDEKLQHTYDNFIKHKHIINMMQEHGYEYRGKNNDIHHFERTED